MRSRKAAEYIRTILMIGTVMTATIATSAIAQEASLPQAGEADSETITVTARKRSESLLEIPISITAYDAKALTERNIRSIADLANNTPGLNIAMTGSPTSVSLVVRGLASSNFSPSLNLENAVGIFIDGIYQTNRNTVDLLEVVDIGQVSLAKGPQSALYGRSTFAGALGITTREPPRATGYAMAGTLGTDGDRRISGTVGGPIIDGILSGSLKATYVTFGGTIDNTADTDNKLGGYRRQGLSGGLNFTPTDSLSFKLTGLLAKSLTEFSGENLVPYTSQNCGAVNAAAQANMLYCGEVRSPGSVSNSTNIPKSSALTKQLALESRYVGDGFTIVSVTGLTRAKDRAFFDYDGFANGDTYGVCTVVGTNCPTTGGLASYTRTVQANSIGGSAHEVKTFSQELRIQSPDANRFQWLAGAFYFDSKIKEDIFSTVDGSTLATNERLVQVLAGYAGTNTGPLATSANPSLAQDILSAKIANLTYQGTKTYSLFGSLGYKITDELRVSAEGRYNIDKKFNNSITSFYGPGFGYQKGSFKSFAPRFTVEYNLDKHLLLYVNAAKGIHSGGFNGVTGVLASETTYAEESNWTYEVGFKGQAFDRRLTYAVAAYKVDWKDIQVPSYSANTAVFQSIVRNLGDLTAKGVDVSADLRLHRMFSFGGSLNYTDAKYGEGVYDPSQFTQCGGTSVCNYTDVPGRGLQPSIADNRPPRSVKLQWNLHTDLSGDISNQWRWNGRVDVNHTGNVFVNGLNLSYYGARTLTNLRFAVENPTYSISVWATNLFDVDYLSTALTQPRNAYPTTLRPIESYLGEKRRVGVTAAVKF